MKVKIIIIASFFSFSPYTFANETPKKPNAEIQHIDKGVRNSKDTELSRPLSSSDNTDTKGGTLTPDISHPSEHSREKTGASALPGDNSGKKK